MLSAATRRTAVDLRTGQLVSAVRQFPTKAAALAVAREYGPGVEPVKVVSRFVWHWAVAAVTAAHEDLVRLALLTNDNTEADGTAGQFRTDWYVQPEQHLAPVDIRPALEALSGELVRVVGTDGVWTDARLLHVDTTGGLGIFERTVGLGAGRRFARNLDRIPAVMPAHRTTTWQRDSTERRWRLKPNGRSLGFRPVSSIAGAKCSCGWSTYASDRAEARTRAADHRTTGRELPTAAGRDTDRRGS